MPPSQRPFMGAIPYNDLGGSGVTFRVWAPFASQVSVAGDFNGWSQTADPLSSEGNGYWSVDVPNLGVGHEYKFVVFNPPGVPLWRMDPYARSIVHDQQGILNGLIASTSGTYST